MTALTFQTPRCWTPEQLTCESQRTLQSTCECPIENRYTMTTGRMEWEDRATSRMQIFFSLQTFYSLAMNYSGMRYKDGRINLNEPENIVLLVIVCFIFGLLLYGDTIVKIPRYVCSSTGVRILLWSVDTWDTGDLNRFRRFHENNGIFESWKLLWSHSSRCYCCIYLN